MLPLFLSTLLVFLLGFLLPTYFALQALAGGHPELIRRWTLYFACLGVLVVVIFPLTDVLLSRVLSFVYVELKCILLGVLAFPRFAAVEKLDEHIQLNGPRLYGKMKTVLEEKFSTFRQSFVCLKTQNKKSI